MKLKRKNSYLRLDGNFAFFQLDGINDAILYLYDMEMFIIVLN
jgi:hypothetical protein